ncbi:MAG: phosphatase PAP2 family protein [Acidobacteriota bacterium]|jgi:membrane-associated phospholipid phosphatase
MSWFERLRTRWVPVDWIMAGYTLWMGLLIALHAGNVPQWPRLVGFHAAVVVILLILPPRGAAWETRAGSLALRLPQQFLRFVRYAYPLLLALFFFEEGRFTVNMIFPDTPYWFEPWLYRADAALFGDLPSRIMNDWVSPATTEVMHFFYWSYYIILIGGALLAYVGLERRDSEDLPAPGFDATITSLALAFVLAFLCYPWLAARGPWENPALMAEMTPLRGGVFTWMMDRIIEHGAVSGNCFPSGHVAGAWAIVFGLAWTRRYRWVVWLGAFLSTGMTVACVYTRYHHAVDMPAGFACGLLGALIGGWLVRRGAALSGESRAPSAAPATP